MNTGLISGELDRLAALDGIRSCALVEAPSGLVWHATARPGDQRGFDGRHDEHRHLHMWRGRPSSFKGPVAYSR